MPWDPKPVPQPAPNNNNVAGSNGHHNYGGQPSHAAAPSAQRVKPEPTTDATYDNSNYLPPTMNPELAHQRAQNLIAQQYGNQASASLNAMQQQQQQQQRSGIALPGQQQKPPGLQLPGQNPQALQQQYAQQMKQQQAAQQPRIKTETDGASEYDDGQQADLKAWQAMMAERRQIGPEDIARNEAAIRNQIAQMTAELESGLLQPHKSKRSYSRAKSHGPRRARGDMPPIPQLDGDFSDDEKPTIKDDEDENAINSDLDDSGDERANDDEEDEDIDSMLCTYDKVQRVKNKWKCTLKDGVLAANGKE